MYKNDKTKVAYVRESSYNKVSDEIKGHLTSDLGVSMKFYSSKPLQDRGIGRKTKTVEHVTSVLEALGATFLSTDESLICLTFSGRSRPMPTSRFRDFFNLIGASTEKYQIMLLEKTARITSISDWHDLQVIGFAPSHQAVNGWLEVVTETFMKHADREAFTMLEPRPAILEANLLYRNKLRIGFLG